MTSENTAKVSLSFPSQLIGAVDKHLEHGQTRSRYFQTLARADLEARGVIEGQGRDSERKAMEDARNAGLYIVSILDEALRKRNRQDPIS